MALTAVVACWAALTGVIPLPGLHRAATKFAGHFETATVPLTGAAAAALPPAGGTAARALAVAPGAAPASVAGPGWSARIALDGVQELVAFTWAGRTPGELQVRVSTGDSLLPWVSVDGTPNEGPDGGTGEGSATRLTSTGPIWVGTDAKAVEVKVVSGELRDLQVQTMHWDGTLASPGGGMATAGAEPADPGVIPRSAWDQGKGWVQNPGCTPAPIVDPTLKMAIVHHTVQANDYSASQVPLMIKADYDFHVGPQRQWCDIAYNFLIDKFGRIWQGRSGDTSVAIEGGHSLGFNRNTVGIALIGQYQPGASPAASTVTAAEQLAVAKLVAWKFGLFGVDPRGTTQYAPSTDVSPHGVLHKAGVPFTLPTVVGHQDTSSTDCPGANAEALLPAIRQQAAFILAIGATPDRWKPFPNPQALVLQQYHDVLLRSGTDSDAAFWTNQMVTAGDDPPEMIRRLLTSAEVTNSQPPTYRLYTGEMGRVPDLGGYRFWARQVSSGARTIVQVADAFAASKEFQDTYGNTTDEQFVRLLYQHVLGRNADSGGLAFWTQQLAGGASRGTVAVGFTESAENKKRTATVTTVQVLYFDLLQRRVDSGGLAYWSQQLQAGRPYRDVVASIYGSVEYRDRVS
jgi:hypothetical protein